MLITCPECTLQLSDKAVSCPHCGYPMFSEKSPPRKKSIKHRRLPNGFGQISEIKNKNLRNPYRAMVTIGHKIDDLTERVYTKRKIDWLKSEIEKIK